MNDTVHFQSLAELERLETALDAKLDKAPAYLRHILTPTQYKYYTYYLYGGIKLADISVYYDVDISTVCRAIKSARKRVISYLKENGELQNEN